MFYNYKILVFNNNMDYIERGNKYVEENFTHKHKILKSLGLKRDSYKLALDYYQTAMKIFQSKKDFDNIIVAYKHIAYCNIKQRKLAGLANVYTNVGDEYFKFKFYLDAIDFYEKSIFIYNTIAFYNSFSSLYQRIAKCYELIDAENEKNSKKYIMNIISTYENIIKYSSDIYQKQYSKNNKTNLTSNVNTKSNKMIIDIKTILIKKYFYANEYKKSIDVIFDLYKYDELNQKRKNTYLMYAILISLINGDKYHTYNFCRTLNMDFEKTSEGIFVSEIVNSKISNSKLFNFISSKYDRFTSMNDFMIDIMNKIKEINKFL